jgi:outer membrane biosynthesis protein TonB
MDANSVTVKIAFGDSKDVRRVKLATGKDARPFDALLAKLQALFGDLAFSVKYTDDEEELITVASNQELLEALRLVAETQGAKTLRLQVSGVPRERASDEEDSFVTVEAPKPVEPEPLPAPKPAEAPKPVEAPKAAEPEPLPAPKPAPKEPEQPAKQAAPQEPEERKQEARRHRPRFREWRPVALDFMQDTEIRMSLMKTLPEALQALIAGQSIEQVAQTLLAHPAAARHPLAAIIRDNMDQIEPIAQAVQAWLCTRPNMHPLLLARAPELVQVLPFLLSAPGNLTASLQMLGVHDLRDFIARAARGEPVDVELEVHQTPPDAPAGNGEEEEEEEVEVEEACDEDESAPKPAPQPAAAAAAAVHAGVTCDLCGASPITGVRFKCMICHNFDLCDKCEASGKHPTDHPLIKLREPRMLPMHFPHMSSRCGFRPFGAILRRCARAAAAATAGSAADSETPHCRRWSRARADFVSDVTLPDGSLCLPGVRLMKVWRLRNSGADAWPAGTRLAHINGDVKLAPDAAAVTVSAAPGEEVDVAAPIVTPAERGRHVGNFRLVDADGKPFGTRFWVRLTVMAPQPRATEAPAEETKETRAAAPEASKPSAPPAPEASKPSAPPAPEASKPSAPPAPEASKPSVPPAPAPSAPPAPATAFRFQAELERLLGMGFNDANLCKFLLLKNNGNMQVVVDWLLANRA